MRRSPSAGIIVRRELRREIEMGPDVEHHGDTDRHEKSAQDLNELLRALRNVTDLADRNICRHEETHRGGVLWEICDMCGAKWADDDGGRPDFVEPQAITKAYELLNRHAA